MEHTNEALLARQNALIKQSREKIRALSARINQPVAIVGMGCRVPGADNVEALWELLKNGREAVSEVPSQRWDIDAYYESEPGTPFKTYSRRAGYLSDVDLFDARFFGISPREAQQMDPQQRLLLEVSYQALEHAQLPAQSLRDKAVGVFIGISSSEYGAMSFAQDRQVSQDAYSITGTSLNSAAGRLAYYYGFHGPALAIDTACSSSLVSIYQACRSLINHECDAALAGGVNVLLTPGPSVALAQNKVLSASGRCSPFANEADGLVRGEGCGVLVLKRLDDALAQNCQILAVIRAGHVNQDGASSGLTVPNGYAQQALITQALHNAQLTPEAIRYVEAHGTGTVLGDPIEAKALRHALCDAQDRQSPLLIGSLKANIGHLEAASGVAGVMKVVLALQHRELPAQIHVQERTSLVDWQDDLDVVRTSTPITYGSDTPYFAGVSSFGFSGTNAHLILQDPCSAIAQSAVAAQPDASTQPDVAVAQFLGISAKDPEALKSLLQRYSEFFAQEDAWRQACEALNSGRSHYPYRAAFVAKDRAALIAQLQTASQEPVVSELPSTPQVAWLFTGQGSQYVQMGRMLFDTQPDFRHCLEQADKAIAKHLGRSILPVMWRETATLNNTQYTQPAIFCLQYALAQFMSSRLGQPQFVLGHSIGEYAAAVVAGVFDLDDAARMIVARGRLMVELCAPGRMLVVFADRQQVDTLLGDSAAQGAAVAVVNGPNNHVLSGPPAAIEAFAQRAQAQEIRCVPLAVSHAFHSPMMTPMLGEFEKVVKQTRFSRPQIGFISTALGRCVDSELIDPAYWVSQVSHAVLFEQAVAALCAEADWIAAPARVCVELGPHKQLIDMARALPGAASAHWLNVLQMGGDLTALAETVRSLYLFGLPFQWPRRGSNVTDLSPLPGYPFSRQHYWLAGVNHTGAPSVDYEVHWREAAQNLVTGVLQGHCLLLIENDELADTVSQAISQAGAKVQLCTPAAFITDGLPDTLALTDIKRVVYYAPEMPGRPESLCVFNALKVMTRISHEADNSMPRLFCVVDSSSVGYRPLACGIASLCRTVREEEHLDITLIGLDNSLNAAQRATALVDEMSADRGGEWERRIVGAQVWVPRLSVPPKGETGEEQQVAIRADRSYLISGGTGALGRLFTDVLLEQGARDLVLLARRADNAALAGLHAQAKTCGARLSVYAVDLSDGEAMQALFKQLRQAHAPLAGIIHGAGQLADASWRQLDADAFARAFDVKASGAWWLDQLSADMSLDFFVMISSIAAVLGAAGQANYAAGNGYLDGLALQRHEQGKPALSVRLGAVANSGMAADSQVIRQLQRLGIVPLAPSLLRARCMSWFSQSTPLALLAGFDWSKISARQGEEVRPFLSVVMPSSRTPSHSARKTAQAHSAQPTTLWCEPAAVEKILTETIAAILDMPDPQAIASSDTLNALGMDSVTLVELRDQLQQQLRCDIPTRILFDFPQVGKLIEQLQTMLPAQQGVDVIENSAKSAVHSHTQRVEKQSTDIAIVGMGCRFPGGVNSPEAFWSALREGRDLIGQIDTLRWDASSLLQSGELVTARAGVLDNIEFFDCDLFGISPREAQCMDPQQRLLLETGWEALERAGYNFSSKDVLGGVFVGPGPNDYAQRFPTDAQSLSHHHSTGNALSVTAGRLAFTLDWQGPTLAVDTACSSSLMAVHLAVQSLRQGECDIALAGGVNLLLSPETSVLLSKGSMLAPDGRCKTFDAQANGYVRSEGCGMVVLKRLDDALAEGDNVLAVVRGCATNQDGRSQGLTAPNGQAQQRVLRSALADAGVDPAQVELLEAHGTGTPLGDPIEIAAAQAVYVEGVTRQSPLWVSSVKTNMGHAEAAAGIAGLIKAVLCLTQKTIAPHVHFSRLNPEIQLDSSSLRIPDAPQPWPGDHSRYAAVSSFGFSGTNVHLILQSAPVQAALPEPADQPKGLRISAASATALNNMVRSYRDALATLAQQQYRAFSQQTWRRAELGHTLTFEGATRADMLAALDLTLGDSAPIVETGHTPYPGMGVAVPCYSFERQRFWQDRQASRVRAPASPQLGLRLSPKRAAFVVYAVDYVRQPPFNLQDHLVHGEPVVPAAAHLALIIGMLNDLRGPQTWEILDVLCEDTLVVEPDTEVVRYEFNVLPTEQGGGFSVHVLSDDDVRTKRHLQARVCATHSQPVSVDIPASARALTKIDQITFYEHLYSPEIRLSHAFRSIVSIEQYVGYSVSEITWTAGQTGALVPGELDSLLQTIALATMADQSGKSHMGGATIPVAIDRLVIAPQISTGGFAQTPVVCKTRLVKQEDDGASFVHELALAEPGQAPFVSIEGLFTRRVSAQQIKPVAASSYYLTQEWVARALAHEIPLNNSNKHPALVFVLLNTQEEAIDPRWQAWLSDAGTLFDANTSDLQTLQKTIDGRAVCLLYCLPAHEGIGEACEEKPWIEQTMALVAAARSAYQISESLSSSGVDTRFYVLSEGHVDISAEGGGSPLYGFAQGLCKSLNLEWPECPVGMLDIDAAALQQPATVLTDEVLQMRSDWAAYRNAQRYVLRISQKQASAMDLTANFRCHDDGLYLLTGGLGDLAVATCHYLAQKGGRHFLLLGRRTEDEHMTQQLAHLRETSGAQIDYQSCDVSNRQALAQLLTQAQLSRPLRGIFHCAGVLADGAFSSLGDDDFERVICSKVLGSWNLHELTQDKALDCFVMYSSLASLFGAAGQSNYAAANGFMDQLAHYRRGLGLPALAINWAGWDDIGMAAGQASTAGLRLLAPARAIADLERAMVSTHAQLGVIDVDWPVFSELWRDSPPALVQDWLTAHGPVIETSTVGQSSKTDILQDLRELPALARVEALRQHLRLMAREIMKLDDSRALDDHKPFHELGFDSLMSIELKQKMQDKFQIRLPATLVFDYPNVESLAVYVVQALGLEHTVTDVALPDQSASMDDLDEDQLAQILETLL